MQEIIAFLGQNILWICLGAVILFILIGCWRANFAYDKYLRKVEKYLATPSTLNMSASAFASRLSEEFFGGQVGVSELPDNMPEGTYTPSKKLVSMQKKHLESSSIASLAIVSHEFGHAFQHFSNPQILIKHAKLNKFVNFLGNLNWVFFLAGIALGILVSLLWLGVALTLICLNFLVATVLKLETIKVEKDASSQAIKLLTKQGLLSSEDIAKIKKFLSYAKATYTADFLRAILGWTGLVGRTKFF